MASKNNSQAHESGTTSKEKLNKILKTLPELNKRLSSLKDLPLERSKEEVITLPRSQSAPSALTRVAFDGNLVMRLQCHFELLKLTLGKLEQFQTTVGVDLENHLKILQTLITDLDQTLITDLDRSRGSSQITTYGIKLDLEGIEKKISDFLYQVPLLSGKSEKRNATALGDQDDEDEVHHDKSYYYFPGIHTNVKDLIKCEVFKKVKQTFMELKIGRKMCLLSFAVFPENREVHRTMLMYWWIGEGILSVTGAEDAVREVLNEFTEKNLIEPVEDRRKVAPSSYKMTPFVHSSVIHLSKEIGFFDIYCGKYNIPSMNMSKLGKVCLVEGSSSNQEEALSERIWSREIETVFNVSERDLNSTVKWFSKNPHPYRKFMISSSEAWFKSLNVFYLGRWERSQKRQIKVQNHELMKCLKHVTNVKLLSLQGISTIRSLNSSICKLHQLIILDLRECYELMKLPEKIGSLRNLVYLDMTGCYMLEWIPLRLALLKNLEVLKGFVVSDTAYENVACKLNYLKNLPKLRKLSIEINRDDFDMQQLSEGLAEFEALTSLKVTWRRDLDNFRSTPTKGTINMFSRKGVRVPRVYHFGARLKKLNLQRFPDEELPKWLYPQNLLHLKKLHIGGGRFLKGFGELLDEPTNCTVEVLRLTSLPKLSVQWVELRKIYFPRLTFFEKYECPKVTLTPCFGNGIWRSYQH